MITYEFHPQGVTTCRNANQLTFFLLGQPPRQQERRVISTGGLNRR